MIIVANSVEYEINNPQYGYMCNSISALIYTEYLPRGYAIWDNSSSLDYRVCKFVSRLNATQTNTLLGIFNDLTKGRGVSVTLRLGSNSGFYPFGPDHGDSGDFGARLIGIEAKGVTEEPWLYFDTELAFVEESKPSYDLPSQVPEGDLQIGTIENLRYPPDMPDSSTEYGFSTQLTYDGTAYTIDKLSGQDRNHVKLSMVCNHSKAAALINHLVGTVRDNTLSIVAQSNNYIFGRENTGDGTYTCQWLNNNITIKHNRFDEFQFELFFYRVSTA